MLRQSLPGVHLLQNEDGCDSVMVIGSVGHPVRTAGVDSAHKVTMHVVLSLAPLSLALCVDLVHACYAHTPLFF